MQARVASSLIWCFSSLRFRYGEVPVSFLEYFQCRGSCSFLTSKWSLSRGSETFPVAICSMFMSIDRLDSVLNDQDDDFSITPLFSAPFVAFRGLSWHCVEPRCGLSCLLLSDGIACGNICPSRPALPLKFGVRFPPKVIPRRDSNSPKIF